MSCLQMSIYIFYDLIALLYFSEIVTRILKKSHSITFKVCLGLLSLWYMDFALPCIENRMFWPIPYNSLIILPSTCLILAYTQWYTATHQRIVGCLLGLNQSDMFRLFSTSILNFRRAWWLSIISFLELGWFKILSNVTLLTSMFHSWYCNYLWVSHLVDR